MSFKNFRYTLKRIYNHPSGGINGILRHLKWQLKRNKAFRPFEVEITSHSILKMNKLSDVNGCVALAWSMGKYDYNNMSFIVDVLSRDDDISTFFDVGGNIGTYALIASEVDRVQVHTFEPHPHTVEVLKANVKSNDRLNVVIHELALSDQTGTISFQDTAGSPVNQVLEEASDTSIEVERITADQFCLRQKVKPRLLKIDVEGHELEAIRGMQESLDECRAIFLEENHNAKETLEVLPESFSGPYYIDFELKSISRERCNVYEDALYVNTDFFKYFCEKNGYSFCG